MYYDEIDQLAVNTVRTLSIDAIEKANSGHPGLPMGVAPMAYALWSRVMQYTPKDPKWANRVRFVLSAGHGSMLLYSLLHLTGFDLSMEDLKHFRQHHSKTPGHPEYGHVPGVETTTGPLGQGLANAVGMAMAERFLATKYNRPHFHVISHRTYVIVGDGDLMEGVSAEAASLAGHLRLGRLIMLYDSNGISLDGDTRMAFTEDVSARFRAYGWQVLFVENGNDLSELTGAIALAQGNETQPTLIIVKTVIGYGSPNKAGKSAAHGAPLGKEEATLTKEAYGWTDEPFTVPESVNKRFAETKGRNQAAWDKWQDLFRRYKLAFPELAKELDMALQGVVDETALLSLPTYQSGQGEWATRQASGSAINAIAAHVPFFMGGSADLASSNETTIKGTDVFLPEHFSGRNIWFGVREHAMGAILNGMALHSGLRVFGGTFLVFSDYLRPAIRMSALMQLPVTYVFTHDSIGVGEDGPTHQPVEHVASLRLIPNLTVIRPADANETSAAWKVAIQSQNSPTALILTRQKLPILPGTEEHAQEGVMRGAYVVAKEQEGLPLQGVFLASGSEVPLAYEAHVMLQKEGIGTRVVSMPSWELSALQDLSYQEQIIPPDVKARVAVEMGSSIGWARFVGEKGKVLGIDRFGASGPASQLLPEFGFTPEHVASAMREVLTTIT